jgi:hypothetical protein
MQIAAQGEIPHANSSASIAQITIHFLIAPRDTFDDCAQAKSNMQRIHSQNKASYFQIKSDFKNVICLSRCAMMQKSQLLLVN